MIEYVLPAPPARSAPAYRAAWLTLAVIATCAAVVAPARCAGNEPFTFVQLCDPQLGMGGYEHDVAAFKQAVAQINVLKPDFAVICGDLVHDADDRSFADFREIKEALEVPCHVVPGNHDVGGTPTPSSLERYREMLGEDRYVMEHKGCAFVFVNTQLWKAPVEGETEKQDAWLERTLETASGKGSPVFIVGHYPLFLEEPDEAEEYMNLPLARRKALLELFERCGVVAVLGGHTHRLIINDYQGMQLVNGETTSKNFDQRPAGFRLWHVGEPGPVRHAFVPLDGF